MLVEVIAMTFEPVQISYRFAAGTLDVCIVPEAIGILRNGRSGPKISAEIVQWHRTVIEEAILRKMTDAITAPTELIITKDDIVRETRAVMPCFRRGSAEVWRKGAIFEAAKLLLSGNRAER